MNIQDWFPLELTGSISLLSKGLSRIFSSNTVAKHQFFGAQPSLSSSSHIHTWLLEKPLFWLCQPLLPKWCLYFLIHCLGLSIAFLARSKCLLISWLKLQSTVILEPKKIKSVTTSIFLPIYLPWSDETRGHDLSFFECWVLSFSLSSLLKVQIQPYTILRSGLDSK